LTQETKFKNYKEYGHPDGSLAIKAVELLLPQMFMEKEMQPMILTGAFLALVMIVLALIT